MTRTRTGQRTGVALAATLTALAIVAACSSGGGSAAAPQSANTSGAAPTGVTLTVWRSPLDTPAINNLYKAYEKASGNKLNLVSLPSDAYEVTVKTKFVTGSKPDILNFAAGVDQISQLNPAKNLIDLSDLDFIKREGSLAKSAGYFNGHTYAVALGPVASYGIFYNKQVFANAGLEPPKTFDDLKTVCSTLKSKAPAVAPIFEAGGEGWPPQILAGMLYVTDANKDGAYVASLMDGSAKLSDANSPLVKGLADYAEFRTSHCFNSDATTAKLGDSAKALLAGKAAMVAQVDSAMTPLLADDPAAARKIGFVGVSASGPVVATTPNITGTYYAPKTGDAIKERAAVDFINFITGKGYQQYINDANAVPTLSGVDAPKQVGLNAAVATALQSGSAPTYLTNLPASTALGPLALQVLAGQISPQDVGVKMNVSFEAAKQKLAK
ncbi:extracellular solute-binding protein [Kribbella aluminosa]